MAGLACAPHIEEPSGTPGWREAPPRLIAHGGGAVGTLHVTNSRQALDRAAAEEFQLIEVDLCWTTDGHLVLLHDWEGAYQAMFGLEPGPRSLEDFLSLRATDGLRQLGLDDLAAWLAEHPRVGIVTDIKTERLRGLDVLAEQLAPVCDQILPQVHDVLEGRRARELGFDSVILTLYASSLTDDEVLEVAGREDYYAVTFPKARAEGGLAHRLTAAGVTTYAHTVNNQLMATRLAHAGVHGIYTDRLTPARGRRDAVGQPDTWIIEAVPGADATGPAARSVIVVDLSTYLDPQCGALRVERTGAGPSRVTLEAFLSDRAEGGTDGSTGGGTRRTTVDVVTGPDRIPLATLFPDVLPEWIAAPPGVVMELRWDLLDRPTLLRRSTSMTPSAWHARGPADDLGGIAVFLLNPGAEPRTVDLVVRGTGLEDRTMTRRVAAGSLIVERMPLDGEAGDIDLSVTGGGVVVHLLRAGPECSMVR